MIFMLLLTLTLLVNLYVLALSESYIDHTLLAMIKEF